MVAFPQSFEPLALPRPPGSQRYDVFSPKLDRRLTLYGRSSLDGWLMIESDPAVRTFCERPGFMMLSGKRYVVDFWLKYDDHEEVVHLAEPTPATGPDRHRADLDPDIFAVRRIGSGERAAARIWLANWQRMLPAIVIARGLVKPAVRDAIEQFVATSRSLSEIERGFSTCDTTIVRAAVFELLHRGCIQAFDLHTGNLSLLTRFSAVQAES
ncbi:hypothetical protein [Paraburkholderia aromaticivorans]|uniref:hypothetical protein n=1 Tax=Paraburkholderia aromaticivorans TaxID=2026199 RepID=UPI001455EBC0|nr:hypothetical protein [Paraburkholderia aromaticivorans]